jgi:hypothetical protein
LWMDNGCLFNTNFKRGVVYKSLEIVNDEWASAETSNSFKKSFYACKFIVNDLW